MKNIVKNTLILFAITLVAGLGLGFVYNVTSKARNDQEEKTKMTAYESVMPGMESFENVKVDSACAKYIKEQVKKNETDNNITTIKEFNCDINEVVEAKDNSGEAIGDIVTVTDNEAYDGSLQMTVGIKNDGTVLGISFLSLSETPGLGMKANEDSFKNQFKNKKADHLLVLTTSDRVKTLAEDLRRYNTYENYLITLAITDGDYVGEDIEGYRVVANGDNVIEVASREIVDEVFLVLDDQRKNEIIEYAEQFAQMGVIVHVNIDLLDHLGAGYQREVTQIGNHYALSVAPRFFDFNKLVMKRIIDIVGAIVGLMITAVVMLFIAPAVKLESPGPLIFKQKRVGKNGRYFYIYKVRSMYQDAEARKAELMEKNEMKGFMFKMTDDPRITKVGKFIRSTSIDELPQFWNVLKGDMSLVGTRPPTVDEFKQYEARHKRRLSMKPGLTGLWQVSGRSNIEDFEEVVRLDCEYIDNWSIQLDIQIILKTVVVIFKKVGSK